eukprot:31237-Pelagococcus_subviridis.AAC.20
MCTSSFFRNASVDKPEPALRSTPSTDCSSELIVSSRSRPDETPRADLMTGDGRARGRFPPLRRDAPPRRGRVNDAREDKRSVARARARVRPARVRRGGAVVLCSRPVARFSRGATRRPTANRSVGGWGTAAHG